MKKGLIFTLIIACAFFMLAGCEDVQPQKVDTTGEVTAESQQSGKSDSGETQDQEQAKTETYKIGDSVKAGNLVFTVNSTRVDTGNEFIKPDEGNIYYIIDVTVENTGDKSENVSSLMMFKLFDSDGYNYNITFGPETKGQVDGEIAAGRKLRGELVFEIPKEATGLELEIDPTLFGSGKIIVKLD